MGIVGSFLANGKLSKDHFLMCLLLVNNFVANSGPMCTFLQCHQVNYSFQEIFHLEVFSTNKVDLSSEFLVLV